MPAERLVEQQHLGLAGERHGDLELALLAMRERAGEPACRAAQTDSLQAWRVPCRPEAPSLRLPAGRGAAAPRLTACTARRTFSSTGEVGKMLVRWNERPTPALVIRQVGSPADVAAVELDAARRSA